MPGANIFLDRVSLAKKKKVYLKKKKSQKQEFFMTGKHENYVNRNYFMLGWQPGTRECQQSSPKVENVTGLQYKVLCPISKLY